MGVSFPSVGLQMQLKNLKDALLYLPFDTDAEDDAQGLSPSTESGAIIYPSHITPQVGAGAVQLAEQTQNLHTNPILGSGDTTGFQSSGGNTIAISTDQVKIGSNSLKCTYGAGSDALVHASMTLTAVAHSAGIYLYIPATYDGTDLRLEFYNFTSATGTLAVAADMTKTDQWQYIATPNVTPDVGDLAGYVSIFERGTNSTIGRFVYIDGIQVEKKAYPTPPCDGSLGTGHFWDDPASWDQTADMEEGTLADFDSTSPAWDGVALMEGNDMTEFDGETDADGDLNASAASKRYGSYGMELTFDDANAAQAYLNLTAIDQTSVCVKFDFDPNTVTLDNNAIADLCYINNGGGTSGIIRLQLVSGVYRIIFYARNDSASYDTIATVNITDGWNEIVFYMKAATGVGENDGIGRAFVDGVLGGNSITLDNDTIDFDLATFGMVHTNSAGFGGSYYFDNMMVDTVGAPYVSELAALSGNYGMAIPYLNTTVASASLTDPSDPDEIYIEFEFDPNTLPTTSGDTFLAMLGYGPNVSGSTWAASIDTLDTPGVYHIRARIIDDSNTSKYCSSVALSDGPHTLKMYIKKASSATASNGYFAFYVDNVLQETVSDLNYYEKGINSIKYGACAGLDATTYGIFYMDDCRWSDAAGNAHASTSSRIITNLTYANPGMSENAGSIAFWAMAPWDYDEPTDNIYFFDGGSNDMSILYNFWANGIGVYNTDDAGYLITAIAATTEISPMVPFHVVVTWDASNTVLYLNGTQKGNKGNAPASVSWGADITIGAFSANGLQNLSGWLDEFIVLDYALTADEVDLLYDEGAAARAFTGVWTDITEDVRARDLIRIKYGIWGNKPKDRVARTGTCRFTLDNSQGNSVGKSGYYSHGHTDVRTGFTLGKAIRVILTNDGVPHIKHRGRLVKADVVAGLLGPRKTKCVSHDWMADAARQTIDLLEVQEDQRTDQCLTTLLANLDSQPPDTLLATGQETYAYFPDTSKDEKTTALRVMQNLAISEFGYIFPKGDGTLVFQDRHARVKDSVVQIIILETYLYELKTRHEYDDVLDLVKGTVYPREVGASNETLYDLTTAIQINAGETKTFSARYTDPSNRSSRISAISPALQDSEFSSSIAGGGDLDGDLDVSASTYGGNSAEIVAENTGSSTGYLTVLKVHGKAIRIYDPVTVEAADAGVGSDRELELRLPYQDSALVGQDFVDITLASWDAEALRLETIGFYANTDATVLEHACELEPGQRIAVTESLSALSAAEYFIQGIELIIRPDPFGEGILKCRWFLSPAGIELYWSLGISQLDIDTYLGF